MRNAVSALRDFGKKHDGPRHLSKKDSYHSKSLPTAATPLTICFLKKQCTMFAFRKSNSTHYLLFEKAVY